MMNILEKIIEIKRKLLFIKKNQFSINFLEKSIYFNKNIFSLNKKISNKSIGFIAEFKRASPSKGFLINYTLPLKNVIMGYNKAGVIGISVLTDFTFFKGEEQDIIKTRQQVKLPLLYKDIIIDEYQVILAKATGSDVILLIAEILSKKKIRTLIQTAKEIGLEVLIELHSNQELHKRNEGLNFIGINNRDLRSFSVNLESSIELSKKNNKNIKFSESGISDTYQITFLIQRGFKGFLIGENLIIMDNPGKGSEHLIKKINNE